MKRSVFAFMTAAALAGCQATGGGMPSYGPAGGSASTRPMPNSSAPTPVVANKDNKEIQQAGYNTGRGSMQNRMFKQRVARAVPSHGGALPGGMRMPHPNPQDPMMFAGGHGHHGHHGGLPPVVAGAAMPGPPVKGVGGLGPRFSSGRTQIRFTNPVGMKIAWQDPVNGGFTPPQLEAPARYNFAQGRIYRLKVSDITNVEGLEGVDLYPTLEVYPGNAKVDAYLSHTVVPIEFTAEDFQQVATGNYVTKVIYLPDPEFQEFAIAGVDVLVSTRLDPGQNPIEEANRRGAILAVIRMGGVDLEMPHSPELFPTAAK